MLRQITMFTKNGCFGCDKTKSKFDEAGLTYQVINAEENPEIREMLALKGLMQMPVVTVYLEDWFDGEPEDTWSGLNPVRIASLVTEALQETEALNAA